MGSIGIDSPNRYIQDPGFVNYDISAQKQFQIRERVGLQFGVDAFNAFNHTQFTGLNSTINYKSLTDPTITNLVFKPDGSVNNINGFGSVAGARDPRILQLVVRVVF